jgi:hypothetical protein
MSDARADLPSQKAILWAAGPAFGDRGVRRFTPGCGFVPDIGEATIALAGRAIANSAAGGAEPLASGQVAFYRRR